MKKLLILLSLFAGPAFAGSYTVTTNATQDAILTRATTDYNGRECSRLGLPTNCTFSQAQAVDASTTFCQTIQAFIIQTLKDHIVAQKAGQRGQDSTTFCQTFTAATTTVQNATCVAVGLAAGCTPCP